VRQALAELSERDRELLMLIAWEGLRVGEAAEALGVRSATLSVRLHRARSRLAAALAAEDVELELEVGR
jgi:RNA polymerase sigma-70 factor (ECF subfamily)